MTDERVSQPKEKGYPFDPLVVTPEVLKDLRDIFYFGSILVETVEYFEAAGLRHTVMETAIGAAKSYTELHEKLKPFLASVSI